MKKNSAFILAENIIEPGTKKAILFQAPNINNQIQMSIPVHIFHGKNPGPKLFVIGTLHGDELNSVEIIRRVHTKINVSQLQGTLITIPVANIYGLMIQSRYLPDRRDLNRSFPGAKKGTLAARLANGILEIISQCQYGIDLHTGALGRTNIPQLRVNLDIPDAKELAVAFNVPIIINAKVRDGSLRQIASERGIPLLVYEGGEALRFNEICIRAGVHGVMKVMAYLDMIPVTKNSGKKIKPLFAKSSSWIRASVSGFVEPVANIIGKQVKKDEVLAYIHDPFLINKSVEVFAPFKGIIIGQTLRPLVSEGDGLIHIANFNKSTDIDETLEQYQDDIINEY